MHAVHTGCLQLHSMAMAEAYVSQLTVRIHARVFTNPIKKESWTSS
jgi:hypothetical protein